MRNGYALQKPERRKYEKKSSFTAGINHDSWINTG